MLSHFSELEPATLFLQNPRGTGTVFWIKDNLSETSGVTRLFRLSSLPHQLLTTFYTAAERNSLLIIPLHVAVSVSLLRLLGSHQSCHPLCHHFYENLTILQSPHYMTLSHRLFWFPQAKWCLWSSSTVTYLTYGVYTTPFWIIIICVHNLLLPLDCKFLEDQSYLTW